MYPVSPAFAQALRESHTAIVRVDAYLGGSLLASDIPITDGSVSVASGTGVRRTLDVQIADRGLWGTLDTIGVELRPYRGIRYPSGDTELVPLGVFSLDSMSMSVGPSGGISVQSAPDRWARVQRRQFETPTAAVATARISAEIVRLVTGAVPGITTTVTATSTATAGPLIWEQDRAGAVADLATSIGAEAYFDVTGGLVVEDAPLLSQTPVWTVDASPSGVLLSGERLRDRARTYNVVVVYPSSVSGTTPYAPVIAADTDPTSRTYVGGPFGRVPYRYTSQAVTTQAQATVAARALLNRIKAVNAQINVESIVNPALDRGDVITVLTPDGTTELHLVDAVTIPLAPGGTQQITTRSSRPEGDVPTGE
ncbi:DUF5047 domain-containing protein [Actinoplanes teichomyceticus]|uniref:Uncharacterized protein DUF5047 n=1 Tax=Actinoplanes teichomyceticus TaxID=1867 RepID=A0A561WAS3_ACTTI|nr:DUF5047 domain-containing protein [Actinoplanes teichomyceticus]TWG20959.1 uncharacterized protein DUF5047 [Actinoplanes teichomyceticus]GIF16545.1 hypothetical protein Ate01nite_65770 [Actinoplanes teichomyceticus]